MYTEDQYIAGALHSGAINPQIVIDRFEDKHKAPLMELGLNPAYLLLVAKQAKSRKSIRDFLLVLPAFLIIFGFLSEDSNQLVIGFLLVVAIVFTHRAISNSHIKELAFTEPPVQSTTEAQNIVISGGYSPFAGYGVDQESWSFTVDTTKSSLGKTSKWTDSCSVELLDFVSKAVASNIKSSTIEDKLFVNGMDIWDKKEILPSPTTAPQTHIPQNLVTEKIGVTDQSLRHYRTINLPIWGGHIHLSIFLRFTVSGNNLFAEARYFLLSPLRDELLVLDNALMFRGIHYYWGILLISALKSTYSWISGPMLLLRWLSELQQFFAVAIYGDPENKLKERTKYNYGHIISLRESWAKNGYHRYFQMLDKDMTYKISQHILVNSIIEFLESKGVATDDIKERRTTIFNSGVMVSGGTINTEQMAVGAGSAIRSRVKMAFKAKE